MVKRFLESSGRRLTPLYAVCAVAVTAAVALPASGSPHAPRSERPSGPVADRAAEIKKLMEAAVQGRCITVTVLQVASNRYAIIATGEVDFAPTRDEVIERLKTVQPDDVASMSFGGVRVKATRPPAAEEPLTRVWPLTFLRGDLPNLDGTTATISDTGKDNAADAMAGFVNGLYPGNEVRATVNENRLVLQGKKAEVHRVRQMLALFLDVPSPQVRADVWTIQVNSKSTRPGSKERAQTKMNEIRAGIQLMRDLMKGSRADLSWWVQTQKDTNIDDKDRQALERVGFDMDPHRPMSMAEVMVFLAYLKHRSAFETAVTVPASLTENAKSANLPERLHTRLVSARTLLSGALPSGVTVPDWARAAGSPEIRKGLLALIGHLEMQIRASTGKPLMRRTVEALDDTDSVKEADQKGIRKFVEAWTDCAEYFYENKTGTDAALDRAPLNLNHKSAEADSLLKQAMDVLTADVQEIFVQPLLDWIRDDVQQGKAGNSGIDLVGNTSIVVRHRTLAQTKGSAEAFYPFLPRPKIGEELLKSAQALSQGDPGKSQTAPTVPDRFTPALDRQGQIIHQGADNTGDPVLLKETATSVERVVFENDKPVRKADGSVLVIADPKPAAAFDARMPLTALGNLTPLQALAFKAVLASDVDPIYTRVAPGLELAIRPMVLPDGGSARVQIHARSTLSAPDNGDTAKTGRPLDMISSASSRTEATVSAFELMEISTFAVQTTRPGEPSWRIPVLDGLPLIGPMFRGPLNRETHFQESISIINLSILPRSIDLVPYLDPDKRPPSGPSARGSGKA